jgi:hypothetical protein
MTPLLVSQLDTLVKISNEVPMGYHGKSWDFMAIAIFTKGNHKIPWGITWKTMGHPSNAMESWGFMGISLGTKGEIRKFHGVSHGKPWDTIKCHGHHGASWGFPLVSHQMPWTSWDFMGIALGTKGNQKIPWGIPWKTMVRFSKSWDTHNMPWELWDAMGITIVAMGNPINPWGIKWKT